MKKPTVLIIEDDQWFAEQYERLLASAGFSVHSAADGLSGMQLLDSVGANVIILDLFLPGPNALVLLHELRSHSDLSRIPVIICSGTIDISLSQLTPYGVREMLDKTTMQPDDLVRAVRRVLS